MTNAEFEEIYKKYVHEAYSFGFAILKCKIATEEVVQQAFINFYENSQKFPCEVGLKVQILRLVKVRSIDYLRKKSKMDLNFDIEELNKKVDSKTPQSILESLEIKDMVLRLIESLPDKRKEVFKLAKFEDLTYKEIAFRLSIQPKTVENHIHLAITELRLKLGKAISFLF